MKKNIFNFLLLFLVSTLIFGVSLKKNEYKSLSKGKLDGVRIVDSGITLAYKIKYHDFSEENLIFSIEVSKNGKIYVGTGHNGGLYLIENGKNKLLYKFDKPDVFSLALDKKGNLYVATSPMGKVYVLKRGKSKPEEFFDPMERFIWDMKIYNGKLYIATGGNSGKLYVVSLESGSEISEFDFDELNIIKIYISKKGEIFVGGGDKGIVYKKEGNKFKSIFSSEKKEIRGIFKDYKNNVFYILANGKKSFSYKKDKKFLEFVFGDTSSYLRAKKEYFTSYYYIGEKYSFDIEFFKGRVWLATGDKGKVLSFLFKNKSLDQITEFTTKGKILFKLLKRNGKLYGVYNYPAGIFEISGDSVEKGVYTSDIIEFGVKTSIFKLAFLNEKGGKVFVSFRGGNSESPDKDWSEWSPLQPVNDGEVKVNIRDVSFFQFKLALQRDEKGEAPYIKDICYSFITSNIAPKIESFKIEKDKKEGEKYYKLSWKAKDLNDDEIVYSLYFRRKGDKRWRLLVDNIKETSFSITAKNFPEGEYKFKLVAKDIYSNPRSSSKKAERISEFKLIDFLPPRITNFSAIKGNISLSVEDNVSPIKRVLITEKLSSNSWRHILPEDGYYNSKKESIKIKNFKGKQIIIKVEDLEGNTALFYKKIEEVLK